MNKFYELIGSTDEYVVLRSKLTGAYVFLNHSGLILGISII